MFLVLPKVTLMMSLHIIIFAAINVLINQNNIYEMIIHKEEMKKDNNQSFCLRHYFMNTSNMRMRFVDFARINRIELRLLNKLFVDDVSQIEY